MSNVQPMASTRPRSHTRQVGGEGVNNMNGDSIEDLLNMDINELDSSTNSSIIDFLVKELDCGLDPVDPDIIFQEINRLVDNTDLRTVDELLLEAERLLLEQLPLGESDGNIELQTSSSTISPQSQSWPQNSVNLNSRNMRSTKHVNNTIATSSTTNNNNNSKSNTNTTTTVISTNKANSNLCQTKSKVTMLDTSSSWSSQAANGIKPVTNFVEFVENLPSESVISRESTPKDLQTHIHNGGGDGGEDALAQLGLEQLANTDDDEDTMEDLTEAADGVAVGLRRGSSVSAPEQPQPVASNRSQPIAPMVSYAEKAVGSSPKRMVHAQTSPIEQISASVSREYALTTPMEQISASVSREYALKQEIEKLQEELKDTEERLSSVQLQSESLSQTHRSLREHNARLQEQSEMLKRDVQHLNECAGVLRTELQVARRDRDMAMQLHLSMRTELVELQKERRLSVDNKEKDARVIQDLQRQCREMERILVRKHPDSVSALIVASKSSGLCSLNDQENKKSRTLLEQRIAQLDSDAKEQDRKAQQILANVQARFNSVQAKYETHIADLETQVLSLQEINTKLNEQIESQVRNPDRFMPKRADIYHNNCTQTDDDLLEPLQQRQPRYVKVVNIVTTGTQTVVSGSVGSMRDHSTNTIGCPSPSISCQQHLQQQQLHSAGSSSTSSTANSTPNTSRPNSKQSGAQRRHNAAAGTLGVSKLPISQSESTLSHLSHGQAIPVHLQDSHLLSSLRSMRIDLAVKNKAMQRLTRELDDCKKTIRKLQREREVGAGVGAAATAVNAGSRYESKLNGSGMLASGGGAARRGHDHQYGQHYPDHVPATTESHALKEAQNKFHLLEADYKALHEKRLQDLKTLQSAHERELASCNETVRILQQRLNEREEATQKRRKVPVDYYALKAKVTMLERRNMEREERLHMLVEALSKGRLNGALEDLLQENNNK